jgi:hypothetical protein
MKYSSAVGGWIRELAGVTHGFVVALGATATHVKLLAKPITISQRSRLIRFPSDGRNALATVHPGLARPREETLIVDQRKAKRLVEGMS